MNPQGEGKIEYLQWFFTRGHVGKGAFLAWLTSYVVENPLDIPGDWLPDPAIFTEKEVTYEWWHFYPTGQKDPKGAYAQVKGRGRGNFPVTVYNLDYPMGRSEDIGLLLHG